MKIFGLHPFVALGAAFLMSGCSSPPKPPMPTLVVGSIQASAQINPSVSGRPSPLLLRVYELKTAASFNAADFMSLYQRDQAELGAGLVGKEEYTLEPGETKSFTKTLSPDTRFLGVVAAYRDLEHAKWRSIVAVQLEQTQHVTIRAGALAVEATVGK
ncbi:MAG: type VI secretion system lipoprotein TssJ [Caldimonas sp.]